MDLGALEGVAFAYQENEERLRGMAKSDLDFAASSARMALSPLNLIGWHIRSATEHDGELCRAFELYEKIAVRVLSRLADLGPEGDS